MFLANISEAREGEKYYIAGKFEKVNGEYVILNVNNSKIMIKHNGLENYKTPFVIVEGIFNGGSSIEEVNVFRLNDDFDQKSFNKLSEQTKQLTNIF